MSKSKVLAIIPARKGSREVPGKNIKLLGPKPLLSYTIEHALQNPVLDTILISTDCTETLEICRHYQGIETPFVRPTHLSQDDTPSIAVVQHALDYYNSIDKSFDYICLLQPTVPFRSPGIIERCLEEIMRSGADSLITIARIPPKFNPVWAYQLNDDQLCPLMPDRLAATRRQQLPELFFRNGSVYLATTALIRKGILTGGRISYVMDEYNQYVNIDSPADWKAAEQLLLSTDHA